MPRLLPLADEASGLEAVHFRHFDIQEYHGKVVGQEPLQRLTPRLGLDEILPQPLKHGLERDQIGRLVVYQEDVDTVGLSVGRSGGRLLRCRIELARARRGQLLNRS
jgi:hypothetical protein